MVLETFLFAGTIKSPSTQANEDVIVSISGVVVGGLPSTNGGDIETIESIKNYAPRLYSSQNRAVTSNDYGKFQLKKYIQIQNLVSVVGGEEMEPPQYGNVQISIKPKNGFFVSDFDKTRILTDLKKYSNSRVSIKKWWKIP